MDDRYIFHWKELPFDGAYYLAEELYSARRQKKTQPGGSQPGHRHSASSDRRSGSYVGGHRFPYHRAIIGFLSD